MHLAARSANTAALFSRLATNAEIRDRVVRQHAILLLLVLRSHVGLDD